MLEQPVYLYSTDEGTMFAGGNGVHVEYPFDVKPFTMRIADEGERVRLVGTDEVVHIAREEYNRVPMRPDNKTLTPAIDFVWELVKEHPEYCGQLTRRYISDTPYEPLAIMMDIETSSEGGHMSRPDRDEILSIQLMYSDDEQPIILAQSSSYSERDMIAEFLQLLCANPHTGGVPDVVIGYFMTKFDLPFIVKRGVLHNLIDNWKPVNRTDSRIHFSSSWMRPDKNGRADEKVWTAAGLPNIDLYLPAKTDLQLSLLPSRSLKNVAKHYGATDVEDLELHEKRDMRTLFETNRGRFDRYALSDIIQTNYLRKIYMPKMITAANLLQIPLAMLHRLTSGQRSYLVLYRAARKAGFYSFVRNGVRNEHLYRLADKYQGAIVGCERTGYIDNTIYLDVKSMYPGIMQDFSTYYDCMRVVRIEDFATEGGIPSERLDIAASGTPECVHIEVPDENYNVIIHYEVDVVTDGMMRQTMRHYNAVRDEFKRKSKTYRGVDPTLERVYDSAQNEAKILNNGMYGIMGNRYFDVCDLPLAIFITAMGRWLMRNMMSLFEGAIIAVDTDGLLLDNTKVTMTIDEINEELRGRLHRTFKVPLETMKFLLEFEGSGSVFMYKEKNYLMKKIEDGKPKVIVKGSSFKGYDRSPTEKRAVELLSHAIMLGVDYQTNEPLTYDQAVAKALDIDSLDDEMFLMTRTVKRDLKEYKSEQKGVTLSRYLRTHPLLQNVTGKARYAALRQCFEDYLDEYVLNPHERANIRSQITGSCTLEKLEFAIEKLCVRIEGARPRKEIAMIELILQKSQHGDIVEKDDTIEFYYTTAHPSGIIIAELLEDSRDIDRARYRANIIRVLERFKAADEESRELDCAFADLL